MAEFEVVDHFRAGIDTDCSDRLYVNGTEKSQAQVDTMADAPKTDKTTESQAEKKLAKAIARRKKLFDEMYASNNQPVILEDFDDLLGAMDDIRRAKGRVEIRKWNLEPKYACDILSMCFGELISGIKGTNNLKKNANDFAIELAPIIARIRSDGKARTYQQVADELTKMKISTFQSRKKDAEAKWYPKTVQNLEDRIAHLQETGKFVLRA